MRAQRAGGCGQHSSGLYACAPIHYKTPAQAASSADSWEPSASRRKASEIGRERRGIRRIMRRSGRRCIAAETCHPASNRADDLRMQPTRRPRQAWRRPLTPRAGHRRRTRAHTHRRYAGNAKEHADKHLSLISGRTQRRALPRQRPLHNCASHRSFRRRCHRRER